MKKSSNGFIVVLMMFVMFGIMSVFSATLTNTVGGFGFPHNASGQAYLLQAKTLDLSTLSVASNDTVKVINIPANSMVLSVQYRVSEATSTNNAVTFDVGDAANAAGYASNISTTNAAGWQASNFAATAATTGVVTVTGYTAGKFYAANDTINVHFDDNPGTSGKIDVTAIVIKAAE